MSGVQEHVQLRVPSEEARTWALAAATLLDFELRDSHSGLLLKADYGPLDTDSIDLQLIFDEANGETTVTIVSRWAKHKLGFGDGALRDRAEKLVRTLEGFQTARDNGLQVPGVPPEGRPPGA